MKKIIATTLIALTAGISVANAQTGSIVSNSEIWQKIHCSVEQKGFKWAGVEKNFMNCGGSNILMNQNFIGFVQNFGNLNFLQNILNETKQVDLAEIYKNFRIEIEKIFEANNNVDKIDLIQTKEQAIVALKKFDTAISNAKALPKNIFFTEYPDFIKIYYKFFANENMSDFAQNENIEFLKEYSKIVAGKNRNDIGFIISYAPNFEYKYERSNNDINVGFSIFSVDWRFISFDDLDIEVIYKEKFYSIKEKKSTYLNFVLDWIDKTKKYDFSVSIKKPNSNIVLNKDFSLSFIEPKIIDTISAIDVSKYNIFGWDFSLSKDTSIKNEDLMNVFVIPYGDGLSHTMRKKWVSLNSNPNWLTLINKSFSDSNSNSIKSYDQSGLYYLLKYFSN